jgi:hypothetical protein
VSVPVGSTTAKVQLCGASNGRVALKITVDAGTAYVTDSASAAAGQGYVVTPSAPLTLLYELEGDIVRHAWYGSATNALANFGVLATEG